MQSGVHRIRIDLENIPIYEKVTVKPPTPDPEISTKRSYAIRTEGASSTAGRRVKDNGKTIEFDDDANDGFDKNASLKIVSTSPGVSANFNGDGTQMIVKGRGDVSLKFKWDDNPRTSGLSVGTLKVGNGSKVKVQYKECESTWNGQLYKGLDFQAIQVLDLVEYRSEDGAELLDGEEF